MWGRRGARRKEEAEMSLDDPDLPPWDRKCLEAEERATVIKVYPFEFPTRDANIQGIWARRNSD